MNDALLRNLTLKELLHEMSLVNDPLTKALVPKIDDLVDLNQQLEKHDIDLSLVVKDYKNFDMSFNDFLQTEYWQNWNERNRSNLALSWTRTDRMRYERITSAAIDGCEGSTHGEIIEDWLACLDERDADLEFGPLTVIRLMMEAEYTRKWFEKNRSIDEIIG